MPIFTLKYLAWRVMVGLHQSVTMSFLLVGHTKFAPDWCFGLFKQRFRRTFVSSLQEIADVVESSAHVNTAQLVGTQNGEVVVPVYDWAQFLGERFRKLPKIKSFQHFTFTSSKPGIVHIKSFSDSEESTFCLLSDDTWVPDSHELPQRVTPPPVSLQNGSGTFMTRSGNSAVKIRRILFVPFQLYHDQEMSKMTVLRKETLTFPHNQSDQGLD